jgi:L-threonylcarbamoyladenylate synthase
MVFVQLQREITRAISYLREGGVVAFPTDTFYALGANVFSEEAVARVFEIKGRDADVALPALLPEASVLNEVAVNIPQVAWDLIERFWPGALTLVLQRASRVPTIMSAGRDTIGVRIPDDPLASALLREFGGPITGTSANPTGLPPARSADEVRSLLTDTVDYVIEGDRPCPGGHPSTVLDLTGPQAKVLRAGKVPPDVLQPYFSSPLELTD